MPVSNSNSRGPKETRPAILRPISPFELRLADIADTWFPEAFAAGRFDPSRLYEIAAQGQGVVQPYFGLTWPEKGVAATALSEPARGALLSDARLSRNINNARVVYCVGDNLEIMKILQAAYIGCFKMAFIDPPYNTPGDFIYSDDPDDPIGNYERITEGVSSGKPLKRIASGNSHSAWLSMMLPRLYQVRNLLRDDGVVFVVIDDHESHRLRMLMDEVFGEENFVCTFAWQKKYSPAPDAPDVGYVHENVLCYRRTEDFKAKLLPMTEAQTRRYKNPDNDPRGPWKPSDYTCRYTSDQRPTLYYPIVNPNTGKPVWPKKTRVWANSKDRYEKDVEENLIWWPPDAEVPAKKKFLSEIAQGAKPRSLLTYDVVGHTDEAAKELRDVLPELSVTPKPTRLIQHFMAIAGLEDGDLILDPFAGVGTVAVAALSGQQQPEVQVVSIEMPEPVKAGTIETLADAGITRISRVIDSQGDKSSGLRVYRLGRTGIKNWDVRTDTDLKSLTTSLELAIDPIDPKRNEDDLLTEIALQAGVPLSDIPAANGVDKNTYRFAEQDITICLQRSLDNRQLETLVRCDSARIIVLDSALGNDQAARKQFVDSLASAGKFLQIV